MYRTISDIKRANTTSGGHYFDPDTMSFFDSHIEPRVYGGCIFITSEQYRSPRGEECDGNRMWSVRYCNKTGAIDTLGKHMAYSSIDDAVLAVEEILELHMRYHHLSEKKGNGR